MMKKKNKNQLLFFFVLFKFRLFFSPLFIALCDLYGRRKKLFLQKEEKKNGCTTKNNENFFHNVLFYCLLNY